MRKLARNITLALLLATAGGAFAHADIATGTDPVPPPPIGNSTTTPIITSILAALSGILL